MGMLHGVCAEKQNTKYPNLFEFTTNKKKIWEILIAGMYDSYISNKACEHIVMPLCQLTQKYWLKTTELWIEQLWMKSKWI